MYLNHSIIVWLTFACLLVGASAQDLNALNFKLQAQAVQQKLLANGDSRMHLETVKRSIQDNLNAFWPPDLNVLEHFFLGNGSSNNLTEECIEGAMNIVQATDNATHLPLVVKMIDAIGKVGPGYFEGNSYASGAYDECIDIGRGNANVAAEYCTASLNLTLNIPVVIRYPIPLKWTFGLCVPSGCTAEDIAIGVSLVTLGQVDANISTITCASTRKPPYNAGAIVMILVCCIFVALVMAGTIFDFVVQQLKALSTKPVQVRKNIQSDDDDDTPENTSERAPLLSNDTKTPKNVKLYDFITAFSLFKILPQILSTKQPPSAITSINGLRVMSMFWVILCHTHFWVFLTGLDNIVHIKDVISRFTFQAIGNAFFSVDSFFFLSGLLVAYLTMRQMKRKNGNFPFVTYYLHRYLRLTPTYAFVLFFIWFLMMHLGDGPTYPSATWEQSTSYQNCKKYWWTNLLYINNLYPWKMEDECIGWTWYLANDMQFYIFSPIILIPLYFLFPIGLVICAIVLLVCFIITGTLTGVYDLQANEFAIFAYGYSPKNPSPIVSFQNLLYIKPWHRVAPYIVGLILGYILYRVRVPKKRIVFYLFFGPLLFISALCLFWTLYGLYFTWHGHVPSTAENVIYVTFSRSIWSLGLALLVLVCHYGYGGPINTFLSMKFWIPLSRISYNAYLLHPLILTVIFASERKTINYQDYNLTVYAIGVVVLSYGAAAIVSVFVEFPIGNLEQALFKLAGLTRHESARTDGEEARPKSPSPARVDSPLHAHPHAERNDVHKPILS